MPISEHRRCIRGKKENAFVFFVCFVVKNKKCKRRQATAVEKIHEFSHSCQLVSTAGAFVAIKIQAPQVRCKDYRLL